MKKNKRFIIIICIVISLVTVSMVKYFSFDKLSGNVLMVENNRLSINYHDLKLENDYIDLYYYDSKRIDITVNFDDVISENKKIVIKLKEGLNFTSLPVMEVTDSIYETQILPTDSLYNAIKSIDTTNLKVEDNKPYTIALNYKAFRSVYDEVIYNINSNIKSVTISLNISSDIYRYYGETNIEDAISVDAYIGNENIGSISNNIRLYNEKDNKTNFKISYVNYNNSYTTKYIRASTEEQNYSGGGYTLYLNTAYANQTGMTTLPYFKYIILTFYCPEDTIFQGVEPFNDAIIHPNNTNINSLFDSNGNVINNKINLIYYPEDNNKVILITKDQTFESKSFYLKYITKKYSEIGELNKSGDYVTRGIKNFNSKCTKGLYNCNNAEITFYDNTKQTFYITYNNEIQIWYPYDIPNTMTFTSYSYNNSNSAKEDADNNTFIFGPYFNIENKTPGEKTNQTIEFEIPSDYQAVGVNFPVDNSGTINNIKYQIYGTCSVDKCGLPDEDGWYTFNKKLNSGVTPGRFTKSQIGDTSNNYYFKAVKGVASSFAESFNSGSSANKGAQNAVVFGNLKSNVDRAKIVAYIYSDEENKEDKKIENYIEKTPDSKEYNTVAPRQYYSSDFFDKDVVKTGESFVANKRLSVYDYPYGNRHFLKDTQIYIREPKGVSLNLNNIVLMYYRYNDKNLLENCDLISGRTNSCNNTININDIEIIKRENDTLYKIDTNVDIGHFLSERELLHSQERYINVEFPYKVDADSELSELKLNELISFGNDNYTWVNQITSDQYDFNNDGSTEEATPTFLTDNIIIQKNSSFIVSSSVKKDGVEYGAYNEDNPNTIINMKLSDSFEYNLEIINNTDKNANFEIYIPIPKKGVVYNSKFKINDFGFNLKLLNKIETNNIFDIKYTSEKELIEFDKINFVDYNSLENNDITMVKLSSVNAIPTGTKYNITINLGVDNVVPDNGIKINIWNTISNIINSNLEGEFYGTKTALKLNYKEISGFIYWDKNADLKYDENDKKGALKDDLIYVELLDEKGTQIARTGLTSKGTFKFNELLVEDINKYKLNIIYPNKNYNSDIDNNYIYELTESNNIHRIEIPYFAYILDFKIIENINIYIDEEIELEITDILPIYFNKIKHEIPYDWMLNIEDEGFIDVNIDDNKVLIKGKKIKQHILLEISIKDKFNNVVSKTIRVNVLERKPPIIYADDIYINVGDEVKFEEYIKKVEDGKGKKVVLIYTGDNKNTEYKFDIPMDNNKAIKAGTYKIEYIVEDEYGLTSKKSINVYVKSNSISSYIPSTLDNIYVYVIIFIVSSIIMILIIKYIKKIKKDYK